MSISLFKHNQKAYEAALDMLMHIGKAAVVHPTGTGKSFIGFKLCEDHPTKTVCWLSPSEYIFKTQLENIKKAGGRDYENIVFFTYAKLMQLGEEELWEIHPDLIILDEFHRCGAEMWGAGVQRLLSIYSEVPLLGLSATAIRYLDNQRNMADELFEGNVVSEMTLGEAIVRGILSAPKYILSVYSYQKDLEKYKHRAARAKSRAVRDSAEKYLEALRRALEKAEGLDEVFYKHISERNGKYIVFCANYEHLQEMVDKVPEWFHKIDSSPHIYSAYSDDSEMSKAFDAFKKDTSDNLKLLFCIDMLNEGIHVDDISGVILFRPTVSPIIYKQQIGRALSAGKKKEPVIFDIVNNIENLYSIGAIEQEMQVAINYYHYLNQDEEIVSETFKIIDELHEARSLFERLNETLTASWDLMYSFAKRYYEKNGNLEVQRRYKTPEGYSLGNWIFTQRKVRNGEVYGELGPERVDKLNAIGMIWDSIKDQVWSKYFAAATKFYQENGNLNVKALYKTPDGLNLGGWLNGLRTYRKSGIQQKYLTEERITALDEIGMIWNVPDYFWEENFLEAMNFYRENGHLNIPCYYISPKGLKIGNWIIAQRLARLGKTKGAKLTEEKIARLDSIGMVWKGKNELAWDRGVTASREYYAEHGNLDVPTCYKTGSGYRLGAWLADRRENGKGKHPEEQRRQLDELGFVWEKPDSWEVRYALAKQYYEEHGDLNIPPTYKADGIWVSKWLNEQRQIYIGNRGKKRLTVEQIERLNAIEMVWENRNHLAWGEAWEKQFERAKMFYLDHGHLNIPGDYDSGNGKNLANWIIRLRSLKSKGNLPEEQVKLLESIGMVWVIEDPWEIGFQHAEEYYLKNGDLRIHLEYVCEDGYTLGSWITNQRANAKTKDKYRRLDKTQIKRLNTIGMIWDVGEFRWEEAYRRATEFYQEHGDLLVPRNYGKEQEFDLYEWIISQRYKYREGELPEDKIQRLEAIGMDWMSTVEREWENNYDKAERYYQEHGPISKIPCTYVDDGCALGMWVWRIKTKRAKLKTSGANGNQVERLARLGLYVGDDDSPLEEVNTDKQLIGVGT